MAKLILLCGKICSGKTHLTATLKQQEHAVVLSCDELMFALGLERFPDHDGLTRRMRHYFYEKAAELVACDSNVILDFGFWTKAERETVRRFCAERHITAQWHYLAISDEDWAKNLADRNRDAAVGAWAYAVDQGLLDKVNRLFEPPSSAEIDVWHDVRRED